MEANELRIGNYGLNPIDNNDIVQLVAIYPDETTQWDGSNGFTPTSIGMKPIPLTEDWLKRFGFRKYKKNSNNYFSGNSEFMVQDDINSFHFFLHAEETGIKFWITEIQYVHQLQNLYFALTGDELKIINKYIS